MSHAQITASILAAGFVATKATGQVQYYARGSQQVQVFHQGLWKRTPDRCDVVTNFAVPGVMARPDKWTQFSINTNPAALAELLKLIAPAQPAAVVPAPAAEPTPVIDFGEHLLADSAELQ